MPNVEISIRAGRSEEAIRGLIANVTRAVVDSIDAPAAAVRVIVTEVPPSRWANGDVTLEERMRAESQ